MTAGKYLISNSGFSFMFQLQLKEIFLLLSLAMLQGLAQLKHTEDLDVLKS